MKPGLRSRSHGVAAIFNGVRAGVYFFILDGVGVGARVYFLIFGGVGAGGDNFQTPGVGVYFLQATSQSIPSGQYSFHSHFNI